MSDLSVGGVGLEQGGLGGHRRKQKTTSEERQHMKNTNCIIQGLTRGTIIVAVATLSFLASHGMAQEKGGERLMKLQRLNTVADVQKVEAGDTIVMSCPKCKDTWVTVVQPTGKVAKPTESKSVMRHACPGCNTKIVTQGVGKQAENKVVHVCKQCGSEEVSCCVMKKGTGPTKGMEGHDHHKN